MLSLCCLQCKCTCTEYLPSACGQPGHKPCVNFLSLLDGMFPGKPVWITEMNRKLGSCDLPPRAPVAGVCGNCSRVDGCEQAEADQASYVGSALAKYQELAATHNIGGVVVYELLDQPHLFPSSEALYGMVTVLQDSSDDRQTSGSGGLVVGREKPVFGVIERWNTHN